MPPPGSPHSTTAQIQLGRQFHSPDSNCISSAPISASCCSRFKALLAKTSFVAHMGRVRFDDYQETDWNTRSRIFPTFLKSGFQPSCSFILSSASYQLAFHLSFCPSSLFFHLPLHLIRCSIISPLHPFSCSFIWPFIFQLFFHLP